MARYRIIFRERQILVPFNHDSTVALLVAEATRRLRNTSELMPEDGGLRFFLGALDGPFLDPDDLLEDVILDSEVEKIFATTGSTSSSTAPAVVENVQTSQISGHPALPQLDPGEKGLKIRAVTAAAARQTLDVKDIPVLPDTIPAKTTLRQLRAYIAEKLSLSVHHDQDSSNECNCSLARAILYGEIIKLPPSDQGHRLIVLHSRSVVDVIPNAPSLSERDALDQSRQKLGSDGEGKHFTFFQPRSIPNQAATQRTRGSDFAIVSVCSRGRHSVDRRSRPTPSAMGASGSSNQNTQDSQILDLHTTTCPILNQDANTTILDLKLHELAVDEVATLFVVPRMATREPQGNATGQEKIYLKHPSWNLRPHQTERGTAMFLSSLRVFARFASRNKDDLRLQDAVLHVTNCLTNFPPAVRALHVILEGNIPDPPECSALVSASYEVLKDMLSTSPWSQQPARFLEASRIMLGMILGKAKELVASLSKQDTLPYIRSMHKVTLVNTETMENIVSPVNTTIGIMEKGLYEALVSGSLVLPNPMFGSSLRATTVNDLTSRAALLTGGSKKVAVMFDLDGLFSDFPYSTDGTKRGRMAANSQISDLVTHAAVAAHAGLAVTPPARLGSTTAPALTLDRDGLATVYVGRQGCGGAPGADFLIFRPTRGGESVIDPSIVTQLLEPILIARKQDGSSIFDGFGGIANQKVEAPDEILMICLDTSSSMDDSAGFADIDPADDEDGEGEFEKLVKDIAEKEICTDSLEMAKQFLSEHESFYDIVITVKHVQGPRRKQSAAGNLLKFIISGKLHELMQQNTELQARRAQHWRLPAINAGSQRIDTLRQEIAMLSHHSSALEDFLVYRALNVPESLSSEAWTWKTWDGVPDEAPVAKAESADLGFSVPDDICCSLTREIFSSPVRTEDGQRYDQNAIQRWLSVKKTSPNTGLALETATLVPDREMHLQVRQWVEAAQFCLGAPPTSARRPKRQRRTRQLSQGTAELTFTSTLGQFSRLVSTQISAKTLYEIAFRGTSGHSSEFNLRFDDEILKANDVPIVDLGIEDGSEIHVEVLLKNTLTRTAASAAARGGRLSLIKVYTKGSPVPDFSYWVDSRAHDTLLSTIFKLWRNSAEAHGELPEVTTKEYVFWHSVEHTGDGHYVGQTAYPWMPISSLLTPDIAKGRLEEELMEGKAEWDSSDDGSDSNDSDDSDQDDNSTASWNSPRPLVLKLELDSRDNLRETERNRASRATRLELLKQMFDQFVNRSLAYDYSTHFGLVDISTRARLSQPITHVVENFRTTVKSLKAFGDTALWDGLALAHDQVQEYARKYPKALKRILCISDGTDSNSKRYEARDVCELLRKDKIVLDSFCLGLVNNRELRAVSHLTGGYKFHPTSLQQAMAICEMEPVLSLLERPVATPPQGVPQALAGPAGGPAPCEISVLEFRRAQDLAIPEVVTPDDFPERRKHPNLTGSFVELKALSRSRLLQGNGEVAGGTPTQQQRSAPASSRISHRILTEMQHIATNPHPYYDVYVSEANMAFWKVVMQGPPGSPYEQGTFVLYLAMEEAEGRQYPLFAPRARFITRIHHPNVNRHGRICHSILDRNWTADTTNSMILSTIYGLLLAPDYSDPVNVVVTLDYHHDEVAFADAARAMIVKHAQKNRAQWRNEILRQ